MITICLKFKSRHRPKIVEFMEKVRYMEQKAVNWLIANKKKSLSSVHAALYHLVLEFRPLQKIIGM